MPGVEVHAQLAEQMLEQKFLARPDYADGAEFLYLATIGLLLVLLLPRLSAGRMAVVATIFIGVGLVVPWIAFSKYHLLFDPIYPPVTLAAIYVSGTALAFMRTERERRGDPRRLRPVPVARPGRAASRAIPSLLQLGGEQREITVMFTDVRGFTTISEQFDPHGPDAVHEPLPDADDRPDPRAAGHDRQIHGRRHHGVLERAAAGRTAMPRAPAMPRSPCRRALPC